MLSRLHNAAPNMTTASDGFFLNLSWVLLHLTTPFAVLDEKGMNPRLKNIDPGYCGISSRKRSRDESDSSEENSYRELIVDFTQETKLALPNSGIKNICTIKIDSRTHFTCNNRHHWEQASVLYKYIQNA